VEVDVNPHPQAGVRRGLHDGQVALPAVRAGLLLLDAAPPEVEHYANYARVPKRLQAGAQRLRSRGRGGRASAPARNAGGRGARDGRAKVNTAPTSGELLTSGSAT
jgi:hypothetical protein